MIGTIDPMYKKETPPGRCTICGGEIYPPPGGEGQTHPDINWCIGQLKLEAVAAKSSVRAAEAELGRFMNDLIAIVGDQVIVGDEVEFSAIVAAVADLRARAARAEAERDAAVARDEAVEAERDALLSEVATLRRTTMNDEQTLTSDELREALDIYLSVVGSPFWRRQVKDLFEDAISRIESAEARIFVLEDELEGEQKLVVTMLGTVEKIANRLGIQCYTPTQAQYVAKKVIDHLSKLEVERVALRAEVERLQARLDSEGWRSLPPPPTEEA